MKRISITGMSGTGKSKVIEALRSRGFEAIDTDYDGWCEFVVTDGEGEWVWNEGRMRALLGETRTGPLFVSGCVSNQGKFYECFDCKVLFSAPLDVMLERVAARTDNPYGQSEAERGEICRNFHTVQPLLRRGADVEIDTAAMGVGEITEYLIALASREITC